MRINKNIMSLVSALEKEIGSECYNPNSYDGWRSESGAFYRYPIHYNRKKYGRELSTKDTLPNDIPPECLDTILYKFGSNHLLIGNGIVDMLKLIDKRYNIDICKLEHEYQRRTERENRERQKDKEQVKFVQKSMERDGYTILEMPYDNKYFMASNEHFGYLIYSVRRYYVSIDDIDDIIQKLRHPLLSIFFNGVINISGMIVSKRKFSRKVIDYAKDNDILLISFSALDNCGFTDTSNSQG